MADNYTTPGEAREQGRHAALAGRPIFANPHIAGEAVLWFMGWRSVPEDQRGSRPELLPRNSRKGPNRRRPMAEAGIQALGDRTLPGSTPKPLSTLTAEQIATRIAYHERVLAESVCEERRVRATRALATLRAAVPCDQHVPTPRPWAVDGVGL